MYLYYKGANKMLKRLLIFATLFNFCGNSFAYQFLSGEEATTQQKQIAGSLVEKAKQNFYKIFEECSNTADNNSLSPNDFSSIPLNEKELEAIVLYFSAKTLQACVEEAENKYLMAEMVARRFGVYEYSVQNDPSAAKIVSTGAGLSAKTVEYTPDYLTIAPDKRQKLEKITKLKSVFNLESSKTNLLKK